MPENLGDIDQKEKELIKSRKLTEEIAINLLNREIRNNLRMTSFDEAGKYQNILNVLIKANGMISDLDWKQFKLLKELWTQEIRKLAVDEVRNESEKIERSEKPTAVNHISSEIVKKAARTGDEIEEEKAEEGAA